MPTFDFPISNQIINILDGLEHEYTAAQRSINELMENKGDIDDFLEAHPSHEFMRYVAKTVCPVVLTFRDLLWKYQRSRLKIC